jgi:NitT/TauT family transport system ATP-binding protein
MNDTIGTVAAQPVRGPFHAPGMGLGMAPLRGGRAGVCVDGVSMLYATSGGQATWALWDVSFTIEPSQFVGAVGPSGCGKTTLLNMLAGFIRPYRGTVRSNGEEITGPGSKRGVVFQEYGLFPWLTVRGNVEFGLLARGVSRQDRTRIVDSYLKLVGLEGTARSYPSELSGGMRQRVAVARSLVNNPELLLMDEPFAAVDALTRATLQFELVKLWQQEGWACFFITHSVEEVAYLAQKVIVMSANPGRIKEVVSVDLPYPRDRHGGRFQDVARRIDEALKQ